ncbi:unnamed protein product, partial [marine sediment metagenome]
GGAEDACARLADVAGLVLWNVRELSSRGVSATARPAQREGEGGALLDSLTALPSLGYLARVLDTEVHKAQRYGRKLSVICIEVELESDDRERRRAVVATMSRTLRTSDTLACEDGYRFWVLVTDNDSLGGVVLKRRLIDRVRRELEDPEGTRTSVGMASYPIDAETGPDLLERTRACVNNERDSLVRWFGLTAETTLAEMGERLLGQATCQPERLVAEAAELLLSDLSCRPRDRGLLFLAPGSNPGSILSPLRALAETATATEV